MAHRIRCFRPDGSHLDCVIDGALTIGRAAGNALVLDDDKASSKHAVIEETRSGKVQLRDLQSTNGTRCNGAPTDAAVIAPGDLVEIGAHRLVLWSGGQPPAPPARMDTAHAWRLIPKHGGPSWVVPPRATVGRSPDRDLCIEHETVSSQHAVLTATAEGLAVEDAGSSNGTWVDGTKVRRSTLKHGQVLAFGEMAFVVAHGNREVAALIAARRRPIILAVVAAIVVLGGGMVWLKYQATVNTPAPVPAPTPAPSLAAPTVVQLPSGLKIGPLEIGLGAEGAATIARGDLPVVRDLRLVVLADDGTLRGRQGDRTGLPDDAVVVELKGRTADGYVWTGPSEGYPFTLSVGVTPRSALALAATLGAPDAPVIGGMRMDLPPGVEIAWVRRVDGTQTTPTGPFSETEADEIALGAASAPFPVRFAKGWSVRGRKGADGWELLVWRRSEAQLTFEWAAGGRTRAKDAELSAIQAAAERAYDERQFTTAVAKYRELIAQLTDADPDLTILRERLSEAERRAAEAGN